MPTLFINHPLVVHCKQDTFDVYIGRKHKDFPNGSIWGNPFWMSDESKRMLTVNNYKEWLKKQPELLSKIPELKGLKLGCWCGKFKLCHGHILATLANYEEKYENNNSFKSNTSR